MKTHKNLMAKILAPDNLIAAWQTARKRKTRTRAVLAFDIRAGAILAEVTAPRRKRRGFPLLRPLLPNWQIDAGLHG